MDHQPFEDWLLNAETLDPRQREELNAHLQGCRACSALSAVDHALQTARQVEPRHGFVNRFQHRLAGNKQGVRRRNALGFALLTLSVSGLLTAAALPLLRSVVQSPVDLAASWLSGLAGLWASIQALFHAGTVLLRVAPGFVPVYIWAILLFGLTGWSVAWVYSLMRYTRIAQGA